MAADKIEPVFEAAGECPTSFAHIRRPTAQAPTQRSADKAPALRSIEAPEGLDMQDCVIWYLGEEGRSSLNLQMTHAGNPVSLACIFPRGLV